MNVSRKTRTLAVAGILTAITFLLGLTPIGYIPLPTMKITILCIPVLIGVMAEGLGMGIWLGFVFGLTSLLQIFMGDPMGLFLMGLSVPRTLMVVFIPRLLVPITAYYSFKGIKKIGSKVTDKASYGIAAFIGSLTNTAFFLGLLYVLFIPELGVLAEAFGTTSEGLLAVIGSIVVTNGIPEAIAAVVLVSAICIAIDSYRKKQKK